MPTSICLYVGTSPAMAGVQTPQINKRFWNRSSLVAWLNSGVTYKTISVDYDVYSSDRFFDVPLSTFNTSGGTSSVYYGSFNNISFIRVDSSFSEEGFVNQFFAFVTHYEVNHIDKTVRFFFMVDWWDTLLYNNIDVCPTGEVERAHINDMKHGSGALINTVANLYGHTSNLDYPVYNNEIKRDSFLLSNRINNVYTYEEGHENQATNSNVQLNFDATDDILFVYLIFNNTSALSTEVQGVSRSCEIDLDGDSLDKSIFIWDNTIIRLIAINRAGRIYNISKISDNEYLFETSIERYGLASITSETLLAMRVTHEIPLGAYLYRAYYNSDPMTWEAGFRLKFSDVNNDEDSIGVLLEDFKFRTTEDTFPVMLIFGDIPIQKVYPNWLFSDWSDILFADNVLTTHNTYENFLNTIIKPRSYPYDYITISLGSTSRTYNTLLYDDNDFIVQKIETFATGDVIYYIPNSNGYTTDYQNIVYVSNNSIFPPYFKDSWLDRINSLEQGAMTAIKAGLSIIGGEVAAIGGVAQMANATNPIGQVAGAGAVAGGIMQTVSGAVNFGYSLHRFAREYRLRDEGYYQTGNITAIDISSYINQNVPLITHNKLTSKAKRRIQELIARYGETTTLFIEEILKDHQRSHFNFIQTAGCVCRPETPVNVLPLKDIEQMFDSGVYLFTYKSDDTDYTPQTAFNVDGVVNYQENFPDEED